MKPTRIESIFLLAAHKKLDSNGQYYETISRLLRMDANARWFALQRMVPGRQSQADVLLNCHVLGNSVARPENHEKVSRHGEIIKYLTRSPWDNKVMLERLWRKREIKAVSTCNSVQHCATLMTSSSGRKTRRRCMHLRAVFGWSLTKEWRTVLSTLLILIWLSAAHFGA